MPELPDLCAPAAELPAAWQVYASRAPSRSYSVWTYWEYAQDVSSSPSPQRRELWGRMIGNLGWPKGCVAFWPVSEPAEPTPGAAGQPRLLARADLFWRGFLDLGAEVLVCFGRPAFLTLFPERRFALTRFVWRGRQVLCLPDPLELASAPAEVKKRVWELLQSLTPS